MDHGRRLRHRGSLRLTFLRAVPVGANLGQHAGLCRGRTDQPASRGHAGDGVGPSVAVSWQRSRGATAPRNQLCNDCGSGRGHCVPELRGVPTALFRNYFRFAGSYPHLAGQSLLLPAPHGRSFGPAHPLRGIHREAERSAILGWSRLPSSDLRRDLGIEKAQPLGGLRAALVLRGSSAHTDGLEKGGRHGRPLCVPRVLRAHPCGDRATFGARRRRVPSRWTANQGTQGPDGTGCRVLGLPCRRLLATDPGLARYRDAVYRHPSQGSRQHFRRAHAWTLLRHHCVNP